MQSSSVSAKRRVAAHRIVTDRLWPSFCFRFWGGRRVLGACTIGNRCLLPNPLIPYPQHFRNARNQNLNLLPTDLMDIYTLYVGQGSLAAVRAGNEAIIVDAHMPNSDEDDITQEQIEQSLQVYLARSDVRGLILTGFDRD